MSDRYRISEEALGAVESIVAYVHRRSPQGASTVYAALLDAFDAIAATPGVGHYRPDLTDRPLRFYCAFRYLVVYDDTVRPVNIVRVYHGAQDVAGHLSET